LRRQRQVENIYRLGPRTIFELLEEIVRHHGLIDDIDRYAALTPCMLAAVGADCFPSWPPLRTLAGGRR